MRSVEGVEGVQAAGDVRFKLAHLGCVDAREEDARKPACIIPFPVIARGNNKPPPTPVPLHSVRSELVWLHFVMAEHNHFTLRHQQAICS